MGKPKRQFTRPSITLADGSEPRLWRNVQVKHLALDDIVSGHGRVMDLDRDGDQMVMTNLYGTVYRLNLEAIVYAFTQAPEASG